MTLSASLTLVAYRKDPCPECQLSTFILRGSRPILRAAIPKSQASLRFPPRPFPHFISMCAERYTLNGLSAYEDDDSEDACDDVLDRSRAASAFYGVSWESFVGGSTRDSRVNAFFKMKTLVTGENVAKWYIGVTFCPVHRFFHEPGPHKLIYDVLHVLYLGSNMDRFEKNWLEVVQKGLNQECLSKCQNKGKGGERVRQGAVRYLYVCLKYIKPPTGGFQDDQVIEDSGDEAKRRKLGPSDDQPPADSQPLADSLPWPIDS